jgi:hypothetical protein
LRLVSGKMTTPQAGQILAFSTPPEMPEIPFATDDLPTEERR